MPSNPAEVQKEINHILGAWEALAPAATFAGMTLTQYKAAVQPSLAARAVLASLDDQTKEAITNRDKADVVSTAFNQKVVKAVVGDVNYGDDSALYEAFGYVRKSERKTGLARKTKAPGEQPPAK